MSRVRDDYLAASETLRIRYCANIIEESEEKGLSSAKIKEILKKTGASDIEIEDAYGLLSETELPSEKEKALSQVSMMRGSGELTPKELRRILSRLAYLRFDEDTIREIYDSLNMELNQ